MKPDNYIRGLVLINVVVFIMGVVFGLTIATAVFVWDRVQPPVLKSP